MHWQTRRFRLDLSRPRVMGIVNLTPDSFSDGGQFGSAAAAIAHCERLVAEGADLLDLGAESSRPGAARIDADEEWRRLAPVLDAAVQLGVPVSVDTCKPEVMRRAIAAGADVINDIQALQAPGAIEAVLSSEVGLCLMHMKGEPDTMANLAVYDDVVADVAAFLAQRAGVLRQAGVAADRITLDPGYGFAKTSAQNLRLLAHQAALASLGHPLLVGWSRKRTLGEVTGRAVDGRLAASLAAALKAVQHGAHIMRVHDVAATVDVLKVWQAVSDNAGPNQI